YEVRLQLGDHPERVCSRRRLTDDLEPGNALGEVTVDRRRHEVVVDDERADHGVLFARPLFRDCNGIVTVKSAPSTFSTPMLPPRRRTSWLTRARPRPRRRPLCLATLVV